MQTQLLEQVGNYTVVHRQIVVQHRNGQQYRLCSVVRRTVGAQEVLQTWEQRIHRFVQQQGWSALAR
jgi:hypothetical protein